MHYCLWSSLEKLFTIPYFFPLLLSPPFLLPPFSAYYDLNHSSFCLSYIPPAINIPTWLLLIRDSMDGRSVVPFLYPLFNFYLLVGCLIMVQGCSKFTCIPSLLFIGSVRLYPQEDYCYLITVLTTRDSDSP